MDSAFPANHILLQILDVPASYYYLDFIFVKHTSNLV